MLNTILKRSPVLVAAAAVVAGAALASGQTNGSAERFTATVIDLNRSVAGTMDIVVNRWSTDAERDRLLSTLLEKGSDKLLDTLQDMPRVGYLQAPGRLAYDLHYARRIPLPDRGERILLATDRRISFSEQVNRPRSIDYPFTVIELRINGDGRGEGKMSLATKIVADKDTRVVVLENYDLQPVMLTNVRRVK